MSQKSPMSLKSLKSLKFSISQPRFHWAKVIPCPIVPQGQALRVLEKISTPHCVRVVFFPKTLQDKDTELMVAQ